VRKCWQVSSPKLDLGFLSPAYVPANYTAISVPVSIAQSQAIAMREGWRMVHCRRGDNYFDAIGQNPHFVNE
jgi:hypothetical protein